MIEIEWQAKASLLFTRGSVSCPTCVHICDYWISIVLVRRLKVWAIDGFKPRQPLTRKCVVLLTLWRDRRTVPGKTVHRKIVPGQRIGRPTLPYRSNPEQLQLAHNGQHRNTNPARKKKKRRRELHTSRPYKMEWVTKKRQKGLC